MTFFDIAVPALALALTGGLYLMLLRERRKLREARRHGASRRMEPHEGQVSLQGRKKPRCI